MNAGLIELATEVGVFLQARSWKLATAESCTGGLVAAAITEVAGSSAWFERGFVTYSNEAKQEMLGVLPATLAQHGAVSEATVREMLNGALTHSRANVAIAISGIAGPAGGTADKPVGTVCMAWGTRTDLQLTTQHFAGDRQAVREAAAVFVLQALLRIAGR